MTIKANIRGSFGMISKSGIEVHACKSYGPVNARRRRKILRISTPKMT